MRSVIVLLSLFVAGCAIATAPPAPEAGNDGRMYRQMLDAALANPSTADWSALRQAYAASPAYEPFVVLKPGAPNAMAAMARGDWQSAAAIAEAASAANTMDLRAELNAAIAERHLGRTVEAERHHLIAVGLLQAILATGNGATPQTAFHVLATSEEYVVLDAMRMHRGQQALVHLDGHDYDRLTATHLPDGRTSDVWFNIDVSLAGESAVTTGRRHPVPQDDLPRA